MTIPVIILNYNSSADCLKCITFLKQQTEVELEIIVVDNCSQADDIQSVEKTCLEQGATLIKNKVNNGFSAGNNIGLRYAAQHGYDYALILNPDMELHQSEYISSLVEILENDNSVAVVGSDILTPNGEHQNPLRELTFWEEFLWPIEILKHKVRGQYSWTQEYTLSGYCEKTSGCCFMIRLSFLEKIGFLDENTFLYSEEPILAKQVENAEMKLYYLASSQAIHMHLKSEKGSTKKRMELLFKSRSYYITAYSGYPLWKKKLLLITYQTRQFIHDQLSRS